MSTSELITSIFSELINLVFKKNPFTDTVNPFLLKFFYVSVIGFGPLFFFSYTSDRLEDFDLDRADDSGISTMQKAITFAIFSIEAILILFFIYKDFTSLIYYVMCLPCIIAYYSKYVWFLFLYYINLDNVTLLKFLENYPDFLNYYEKQAKTEIAFFVSIPLSLIILVIGIPSAIGGSFWLCRYIYNKNQLVINK